MFSPVLELDTRTSYKWRDGARDKNLAWTGHGPYSGADVDREPGYVLAAHLNLTCVYADDVTGMAVHTGARVSALAGAGEVLVSSTVRDLVVGSAIEFTERGEHALKGVPGTWRLFAVTD